MAATRAEALRERARPAPRRAGAEAASPDDPVGVWPGIGPARAEALERLGLARLRDLLLVLPRQVAAAPSRLSIADALGALGRDVRVAGRVERVALQRYGRRSTLRVTVADASGSLVALYFNQPWMRRRFAVGDEVELAGRVVESRGPALSHPRLVAGEAPGAAAPALVSVYPQSAGLGQETLAKLCRAVAASVAARLAEPIPPAELARLDLPALPEAVRAVHEPPSLEAYARARSRVVLERFLGLQAELASRRADSGAGRAPAIAVPEAEREALAARLPFQLTAGQRRVLSEILGDLARPVPMRRLLQGDVGSGKTAVAALAALAVARAGAQAAILAPTEILAEQHAAALAPLAEALGVVPLLVTASASAADRAWARAVLAGEAPVLAFGTHALLSEDLRFARLGLAVIDEQQRFGVAQRSQLLAKGAGVHALLMSATPIPRTLALTLYGDLDVSLLDEKPPGRGRVTTRWVRGTSRARFAAFLEERLSAGERVYWVVPRIGAEGEDEGVSSAERARQRLAATALARHGIELVHGRLAREERQRRLARFRGGEVALLVATTVVEVGVDVPEATVMVVESAERLGLAQLHQLRGRVGRASRDGWFLLFGKRTAAERFELLEREADGFAIAEADLRLRGMGDLAGLRQSGANLEGLAAGEGDLGWLFAARDLLARDPDLRERYAAGAGPAPTP